MRRASGFVAILRKVLMPNDRGRNVLINHEASLDSVFSSKDYLSPKNSVPELPVLSEQVRALGVDVGVEDDLFSVERSGA